jgi:chorismate synthase
VGHVLEIAGIVAVSPDPSAAGESPVRCGDADAATRMEAAVERARQEGDSVGGVIEVIAAGLPAGWGDPVFGKLDALLAGALMGIGAVKGVEVGDGFAVARMMGSEANDAITPDGFATNHAGGVLGGISTGQELVLRCAVKPTPSIRKAQRTVDVRGETATLSVQGRHDPCIAPRLVPVAEAMVCLVLGDAWLAQRALTG